MVGGEHEDMSIGENYAELPLPSVGYRLFFSGLGMVFEEKRQQHRRETNFERFTSLFFC